MKVLSFGYGRHLFKPGDTERERLTLCAGAVETLHHVVFTKQSDGLQSTIVDAHFILHPTHSANKVLMLFDALRIGHRLVVKEGIDVVTTQDPFETGLVGLMLKIRHPHLTLQVQEHGDVLASRAWVKERSSNRFRRFFAFIVLRYADIVRVVSARTEQFLRKKYGPTKDIRVLPVSVAVSGVRRVDRARSRDSRPFIFLTAARFVPQKNLPMMIRAFARVYVNHPNIRLRIFGGGALEAKLRALVISFKISEAVDFKGWTQSLCDEMALADAYLLSSNYEGWGRVLIEALLANLPIVTTDVGCAGEVIKHEQHGLIVPVGDEEQFAHAMEQMCTDNEFYDRLVATMQSIDATTLPGAQIDNYGEQWIHTMIR